MDFALVRRLILESVYMRIRARVVVVVVGDAFEAVKRRRRTQNTRRKSSPRAQHRKLESCVLSREGKMIQTDE